MPVALLLLLLLPVVVGLIGAAVTSVLQSRRKARARALFAPLSLRELQGAAPPPQLSVSTKSPTIYGIERLAWFEALLDKTFTAPSDFDRDRTFLLHEWIRMLYGLLDFLRSAFPGVWGPGADTEAPAVLVVGKGDLYFRLVVEETLDWLKECSKRYNALAESRAALLPVWNAGLFTCGVSAQTSAFGSRNRYSLSTPCNAARLESEIRRLESSAGEVQGRLTLVTAPDSLTSRSKQPFRSAWTIWCFIPWLNWIAWVHAGIRAKRILYGVFGAVYAIPMALAIAYSQPKQALPDFVASIGAGFWLAGILHVFVMRKSVNRRIAQARG